MSQARELLEALKKINAADETAIWVRDPAMLDYVVATHGDAVKDVDKKKDTIVMDSGYMDELEKDLTKKGYKKDTDWGVDNTQ